MFTIKVKDNGTGLRVKSAVYTLLYTIDTVNQQSTTSAVCTWDEWDDRMADSDDEYLHVAQLR